MRLPYEYSFFGSTLAIAYKQTIEPSQTALFLDTRSGAAARERRPPNPLTLPGLYLCMASHHQSGHCVLACKSAGGGISTLLEAPPTPCDCEGQAAEGTAPAAQREEPAAALLLCDAAGTIVERLPLFFEPRFVSMTSHFVFAASSNFVLVWLWSNDGVGPNGKRAREAMFIESLPKSAQCHTADLDTFEDEDTASDHPIVAIDAAPLPATGARGGSSFEWSRDDSRSSIKVNEPHLASNGGSSGQTVRTAAPLPMTGRHFVEVAYNRSGGSESSSLGSCYETGLMSAEVANKRDWSSTSSLEDSRGFWGADDSGDNKGDGSGNGSRVSRDARKRNGRLFCNDDRVGMLVDMEQRSVQFYVNGTPIPELHFKGLPPEVFVVARPYNSDASVTINRASIPADARLAGDKEEAAAEEEEESHRSVLMLLRANGEACRLNCMLSEGAAKIMSAPPLKVGMAVSSPFPPPSSHS